MTYTCAHAHARTHTCRERETDTHANAMAAARAEITSTRTPAKPTADQMRVLKILEQLDGAPDSRGSGKLFQGHRVPHGATDGGKEGGRPAGEGRAYGNLGITYYSLGDYAKAIEYHGQHLAIAQEVGDRAGERAVRSRTSATRISRRGAMRRPSSTTLSI